MCDKNQTNLNPHEQNINQICPNLYYNEPDPFGIANYNVIEQPNVSPERIVDFPEELKNLSNQPLNAIPFPEGNNTESLNSTVILSQRELNDINIPYQNQEQQPSIIDGIIFNCRNDPSPNSYCLLTQSQLMGTEQLSQFRSSIMPNKQLSQNNDEFIKVKGIPTFTSFEYENFQQNTVKPSRIPEIKAFLFKNDYFHEPLLSDAINQYVDVPYFYNSYCKNILLKKRGLNLDSLKQYVYAWRKVRGDGNCFYRAVIFRYMEILILNKQIDLLKNFVINVYKAFQGELSTKLKITQTCTINKHYVFSFLKAIIDELEMNGEKNAYQLFLKAMNMTNKTFDYAMVLYFRYLIYSYIKENENKLYLKEFDIKIGNLLPIEYETKSGNFLWKNFYEKYLMKMFNYAEKIIIYLTPFVLGVNIDVLLYEDIDNPFKRMKHSLSDSNVIDDNKQMFLNNQRIYVLNINNHYDLIYSKEEFAQVMKFADNQIIFSKKSNNKVSNRNNANQQGNYNKQNDNKVRGNNMNNINHGQFINQNMQQQRNPHVNQNFNYKNHCQNNQNMNCQMNYSNQNLQNVQRNQYPKQNHNQSNNHQFYNQNVQPIKKDGVVYYNSINDLQENINSFNSNNNNNNNNLGLSSPQPNINQLLSYNNYVQPSPTVPNNNNHGMPSNMNNQQYIGNFQKQQNYNSLNNTPNCKQYDQQKIIDDLLKLYKHNIDQIKKIYHNTEDDYQYIKSKVDNYAEIFGAQLKRLQTKYNLDQKVLRDIFKDYKGNICVCCTKDIDRITNKQYISLPCRCSICSKNCLKSYYCLFFTFAQRCYCLQFYVPLFFEHLKYLLETYLQCNNLCEINNIVTQQFEDYCCGCLKENKQKDFEIMKFYFYDNNSSPKCFEKSDKYKILSQELQRHRVCFDCRNNILKNNIFRCRLCNGEHSLFVC